MALDVRAREVIEGVELQAAPPADQGHGGRAYFSGRTSAGKAWVNLTDDIFSKHLCFLGGIGTGKTNAVLQLLDQLKLKMTDNDVMIVFDTKGDFYNAFYAPGDVVISNDNKARGPRGADYWNIFAELSGAGSEENINEIAKTLFYQKIKETNNTFFPNAAKDIFAAVLMHQCREGGNLDNKALRDFFNSATAQNLRDMLAVHPDLEAIISYIADDSNNQTPGVLSELQQLVREIFIGNFNKPGSLSMRQLVRAKQGRTIFVEYDLAIGNMLTPIYRLLFDLAIKEALSREKSEGNVWFVVDEFRLLPHLQHVENAVNFGRSLGAKFIIGIQNVEQIYDAYGELQAKSILSGFSSKITFRLNDGVSNSYIKDVFGRNRKYEAFVSNIRARGLSENTYDAYVVEDWDLTRLAVGEAIIGLPGQAPFRFQFDEYK